MKLIKQLLFLLISLSLFAITKPAYAQEEFDTYYLVKYSINPSGETQITQDISIENKQNSIFATNYTLTIRQMHIYDVKGNDAKGSLDISENKEKDATNINVNFNDQIIGAGRTYDWQLSYKTKDVASKVGEIWNIHIPKVDSLNLVKQYDITLTVPKILGPEIFMSPQPILKEEKESEIVYHFNKDLLQVQGITASFGKHQTMNFKLKYKLQNDTKFISTYEVAIPNDIPERQQVFIQSLNPLPDSVSMDKDNNMIATYKLKPNEIKTIEAIGQVKVSGKQIIPEFGGLLSDIPSELTKAYTKPNVYWEVNSGEIQNLAKLLYKPENNVSENARAIYDYIIEKYDYDFNLSSKDYVERNGALKALAQTQSWACMEFTDVFIAISRAMGIPARELNGFAYSQESTNTPLSISLKGGDLLHAWPEYFDPAFGWVAIDPTWGETSGIDYFTKLDTNHFVFVTKGLDSQYPLPAGMYKTDENEKHVKVDFAQNITKQDSYNKLSLYKANSLLTLFPRLIAKAQGKSSYILYNESGTNIYNVNGTGKRLLPFQNTLINIPSGETNLFFTDQNGTIYQVIPAIKTGKVPVSNAYSTNSYYLAFFSALLLCAIFYFGVAHLKVLKKVIHRLDRHRQDQGQ